MNAPTLVHVMCDGVSLAVHRHGAGNPVVCLHAIGHDAHDYDAFGALMAGHFELICIDWPGHGQSSSDTQSANAERYAALLTEVLDKLGVESPIVIGNSVGGAAAVLHAARRSVRALVLCDTAGLVKITPAVGRICRVFERFFAAGERGAFWFPVAYWAYYRMVLRQPAAAAQRRRIVAAGPARAKWLRQAWSSFGRPSADIRAVAEGLTVPTWVAWAEQDRVIPLRYCLPAIQRMKQATLTRFQAGHSAFLEQPQQFAEGFRQFVARLPAAPSSQ